MAQLHEVAGRSCVVDFLPIVGLSLLEASRALARVIVADFLYPFIADFSQFLPNEFVAVGVIFEDFLFAIRNQHLFFDGHHFEFVHLL